jgi:glutathione S-transferase
MAGHGNYATIMDTPEKGISGSDYIAGGAFTAADVYVGSQIGWGLQFGTIEVRPAFQAYWQRVSDGDACRRANDIDDALMPSEAG